MKLPKLLSTAFLALALSTTHTLAASDSHEEAAHELLDAMNFNHFLDAIH